MPTGSSPRKPSFEDLLDRSSDSSLKLLRKGFLLLSRLAKDQVEAAVDLSMASMDDPHVVDKPGATDPLGAGLSEDESFAVVVAGSFLSRAVGSRESADQIGDILKKKFSFNDKESEAIPAVLARFQQRGDEIQKRVERQGLANAILPSFEHIRTSVDIRLKLVDGRLSTFAPVAVAFLWTDEDDEKLWFQLSKEQLERLIDELNGTLKDMKEKEEWIKERSKSE